MRDELFKLTTTIVIIKSVYPIYLLQSVPVIPSIPGARDVWDGFAILSGSAIPDSQPWRDASYVTQAPPWIHILLSCLPDGLSSCGLHKEETTPCYLVTIAANSLLQY